MRDEQENVRQFMEKINVFAASEGATVRQKIGAWPQVRDGALRAEIIMEEARETAEALTGLPWSYACDKTAEPKPPDILLVADGCADIAVVTLGTAVTCGFDLTDVFWEVQTSNWKKLAPGATMREDGKLVKPPDFTPPDIAGVLRKQGWKG